MIAIVLGSKSDLPIFNEVINLAKKWNIPFELRILSTHRTIDETIEFAKNASEKGIEVIIAAAGASAALPGIISACTHLPVIGVPISSTTLAGLDALLSMVQMPKGTPVGVVSIGEAGAMNAFLFALRILASKKPELKELLKNYREELKNKILKEQKIDII